MFKTIQFLCPQARARDKKKVWEIERRDAEVGMGVNCSRCKSREIHVSRSRSVLERRIMPLLLLRPARCGRCGRRFYRLRFLPIKPQPAIHCRPKASD
ncbi:MAG TPA: hypothetical protein VK473_19455 [Terriglobales bacterium]|nr:hypothetical protein [Terriglobales bacterium]